MRACTHCDLPARPVPLAGGGFADEAFCCSGCFLAHHFAATGVADSADRLLARVLLSAMLAMGVMMLSLSLYGSLLGDPGEFESESAIALEGLQRMAAMAVSAPVLYLLGLPLAEAVIRLRRWLSADALIVMGTGAAWSVSVWNTFQESGEVYFDTATMVLVLVGLGRWLDVSAKQKARAELELVLPERERDAVVIEGGREVAVSVADLRVDQIVRIRPGEVVPVDGFVTAGQSFVDTSDLTGEAQPRSLRSGDRVLAGSRVEDGCLDVRASEVGESRLCAEIERLLDEARRTPPRSVRLADRVAAKLIPIVFLLAIATAAFHWNGLGAEGALLAALSVILIACPCALGIATPLVFWTALAKAWKLGVLVRGGDVLEQLARAERVWLDKTGTLTDGRFELTRIDRHGAMQDAEILHLVASLESGSEHPIGLALREAWREQVADGDESLLPVDQFRALPGVGVEGEWLGVLWSLRKGGANGSVRLWRGSEVEADLHLSSQPREESRAVVESLRRAGLQPVVLTGDSSRAARRLAGELGIEVESDLSPLDKLERVREMGAERAIFVGDGLNDAAALAAAGVGISVAGGSARSMDAASINLLRPGLGVLPEVIELARRATRIARWNLFWAFGYNAIALGFAVTGHLPPIAAAAAMVASSVAVVLNSWRLNLDAPEVAHSRAETRAETRPETPEKVDAPTVLASNSPTH